MGCNLGIGVGLRPCIVVAVADDDAVAASAAVVVGGGRGRVDVLTATDAGVDTPLDGCGSVLPLSRVMGGLLLVLQHT